MQGCASYSDKTVQLRGQYHGQNYAGALDSLEGSTIKTESRNRLLYQLEKAQILDRKGDLKASRTALMRADAIADDLYTTSIGHQLTSFIINDASTEYSGEDYEVVAIHIALALSFLEDEDLKGALVEARKINSKLGEINQRYDDKKNRYTEDAFARYLAGMIYEASGNIDSAIVDYRRSISTYDSLYLPQFGVKAPRSLLRAYYRALLRRGRKDQAAKFLAERKLKAGDMGLPPSSYGRVVVIHEVGTINSKVNSEHLMSWTDKYIRFSFPNIAPSPTYSWRLGSNAKAAAEVVKAGAFAKFTNSVALLGPRRNLAANAGAKKAEDHKGQEQNTRAAKGRKRIKTSLPAEPVQDMNIIAHHTLEDRRGRVFAKSVARLVVKDQLAQKANKEFGPIAGLLVGIAGMVTETGDTRSWALLPASYEVSELYLPPGRHEVLVRHDGKPAREHSVTVKAGRPVFIRAK